MRNEFSRALSELGSSEPKTVFLTGDLGFNALEPVRDAIGDRFINMGVAEQNMISAAAGMAKSGLKPWCYSIAPFAVYRPFEQIRNDVCYHNLAVTIVGNGGGFTYGSMGFTHHAIEDYGALATLPNLRIIVPAFASHIPEIVARLSDHDGPAYLRLGRAVQNSAHIAPDEYRPYNRITKVASLQVLVVGPLAAPVAATVQSANIDATVWAINEPFAELDSELKTLIVSGLPVLVIEEHVQVGSFAANLVLGLANQGIVPSRFRSICARREISDRSGSEEYLRALSGLDEKSIIEAIENMLSNMSASDVV